jgi:hypothetical protein
MHEAGGGKLKPLLNIVGRMFKTLVIMNEIAEFPGLRESERAFIAAPLICDENAGLCCDMERARRMVGPAEQHATCSLLQKQLINKSNTEAQ